MSLRLRLALAVLATTVPLAALVGVGLTRLARENARERVAERIVERLEVVGRERCEADPESLAPGRGRAGRGRPRGGMRQPRAFDVYDDSLQPVLPGSRPLSEELAEEARGGRSLAVEAEGGPRGGRERLLVRAPWSGGRCAFVAVTRAAPPRQRAIVALVPALAMGVLLAIAMAVVSGPLVRRIERLADGVRRGSPPERDLESEDELGVLARALRDRESAREAHVAEVAGREKALRDYIADTTHDVLVPLTVIVGELDAIARTTDAGALPDRSAVRTAIEEAHYVGALLHNLNARARLEGGLVVTTDDVDLERIVERVVARHRPLAARARLSLEHAVPGSRVLVHGDPTLLEQAISNLVHNAIRHHPGDGHVAVVLEVAKEGFELRVLDDGPGVPETLLGRLGERGFRVPEARTRSPEGTGLGLHIVREVAARHGFGLAFAPNPPHGLVVTLRGPLARGPGSLQ
ncbi:MAG: HAMP domain-containing sensor histidine kinase [Polyangiales bacterium]